VICLLEESDGFNFVECLLVIASLEKKARRGNREAVDPKFIDRREDLSNQKCLLVFRDERRMLAPNAGNAAYVSTGVVS
jgi:hypothetical protein